MKKMLKMFVALAAFGGLARGDVFLETGFEGATSLPAGWTQSTVSGSATWTVRQGGAQGTPSTAHSGTNNASLFMGNKSENKTQLISPVFNTVGFINISLSFWHTQPLWDSDQDQLKVFFSSNGGTNWTQLAYYTTSVPAWTKQTLAIPSASANCRIMFEGNARFGSGVCLDDIQATGISASLSELFVSATDASASEVGSDPGTWTITRTGNTTEALSVNFTLSGTATQGSDYTVASTSPINFAAGETSKLVTLTPIDDVVEAEGNELATLTLTAGTGYAIGTASGSISIYDDEGYDLNVLIIGSTRDSSQQFGGTSKPFSPTTIGAQLQSVLAGSGLGSVNVVVTDRYATDTTVMGRNTYAYNLASWFHWPFPKGAESARWANLRGEAGTVWDYVVLIGDPYTIEYTPGVYAYGAAKVAEEVAKGSAETILLMPWPASGSSRDIAHYKDVVYRVGRSGGIKVAPGGLAWQAIKSSALTNPNPNADGAFIAAASIYSTIYNQSAAASTYVYNDTWANTVNTTEASNRNAQQYTGGFSFQNPYLFRSDSKRKIYFSSRGSSTEDYFRKAAHTAIDRCGVSVTSHCPWNRTEADWAKNGGDEAWTKWPADFVPPIAWNDGRDGATAEWYKSYQVNPTYWDFAYGYIYHANTWSNPVEDANDHFVSMMSAQDNELANRMMSQGNSARNLPVRTLWAQIHKEFPSENPLMDGSGPHLSQLEHEAVGTYMYTLYSGRCPLDPEPATLDKTWVARKIGYETAWRLGRCQMRAPGFKVMPSAASKTSITPGTTETMSVRFILPPKQDVTVNVSISNTNAAMVGSQQLVFTPQNYNVPQNVVVAGLAGSAASETFNVVFTTVSTDEVYNGLSDTWDYKITRSEPVPLIRDNKTTSQVTAYQNLPVSINLNTAGAISTNTILSGPSHGVASWSGSNVIYTPSSDFLGKDGFSFATNNGSTLSVGYVEITVTAAAVNGMVSYRGNGSDSGTVPIDSNAYAQNAAVTVLGNTGALARVGYNFAGWNTAADGKGTDYTAGATFPMGASGMVLYAKWTSAATFIVTYNGNSNTSGSVPYNQTKTNEVDLILATNIGTLGRTGYTFSGWNTAADGTGKAYAVESAYSDNANLTLYAKWTIVTYAVNYNVNSATSGTAPANQIKTHGVTLVLQTNSGNLARLGYIFSGWNTKADGTGTNYAVGANYTGNAAVTLHAKWTPGTSYAVSYNANGATSGAVPADQSKLQDVALTLATNAGVLAQTGYTFAGWNTAADGSGTPYTTGASYVANAAAVLYAQWTLLPTYTISYSGNGSTGGAAPSNQTKIQGVDLTLSGAGTLVRTGYTFSNWNTSANGYGASYAAGATYTADAPAALHAQWGINTYVVSYDGNGNNGGVAPTNQAKTHDIALNLATNTGTLARTGYTFAGWNTQADGFGSTYAVGAAYVTNSTLVLYSKWTANSYTVTFDANGGDAPSPSSSSVTFGSTYGALPTISRMGYTFNGWFTATSGGTAVTSSKVVTEAANHTLYAQWTASSYIITFDANGGDTASPTSKSVTYGSTYGTLATTNRAGYTFNGWFTATSGGTQIASGTTVVITSAQTLYAQWIVGVFLTWDANGTGADQINGAGAWGAANLWWNGMTNASWQSGSSAKFGGPNTAGGAVTLAAPTTVKSFTFNQFTGTYTLGTAGQTIALNSGIINNAGSGAVTFVSPITLGAAQTWTNNSTGLLKTGNGTLLANGGFQLAIDGTGNTELGQQNVTAVTTLTGSGALVKNGTGTLFLGGENPGFSGDVILNEGVLNYGDYPTSLGTGNLEITNGILQSRWDTGKTWARGTGAGAIQITGGESGFASGNGATFDIGAVTWGSSTFNPTKFAFNYATSTSGANVKFSSAINLNGATRIITVDGGVAGNARAELTGVISGTGGSGLTKEGAGFLLLTTNAATSSWNGNTTVSGGLLHLGAANLANIGGGSGRNISVAAGGGIGFSVLSNTILNRIVETSAEISVMTGTTSNALDFSSSSGATLPNAFLGAYASNSGKCELSGVITPSGGSYRLGAPNLNSGTLGITQASLLSGTNGLIIGANRVVIVGTHTFTGDTVLRDGAILGLSGLNTDAGAAKNNSSALQNSVLDLEAPSSTGQIFLEAGNTGGVAGLTTSANGGTQSATFGGLKGSRNLYSAFKFSSPGNNASAQAATAITGFTLNPGLGVFCSYSGAIADFAPATRLTKTGLGTQILAGASTYSGTTTVSAGKLFINGDQSSATGNVTVAADATLGGTGALGGSTTVAAAGQLEFNLSTGSASHDPLNINTGKGLTFSGASVLTITSTGGASPGTYTLITGGNNIVGAKPATVNLPAGWVATVSIFGNNLLLNVITTGYRYWVNGTFANGTLVDQDMATDPDGDGLATGVEWVLGGDPTLASDSTSRKPVFDNTSDANYFIYSFSRSDLALADSAKTSIVVEYGSDLSGWIGALDATVNANNNADIEITETDNAHGAGVDRVDVKIKRNLSLNGKLFARLKVRITP